MVNLSRIRNKEKACINLKILISNMMGNFKMENFMEMVYLNLVNKIFMMVNLKITSFMVQENQFIISKFIQVISLMVRNMVKVLLNGKMIKIKSLNMTEIGYKTIKKATANYTKIILYNMRVNGKMVKKMGQGYSDGVKVDESNANL